VILPDCPGAKIQPVTPMDGPAPSHASAGYECPLCFLLAGGETALDSPRDIVLQT
jgi:hypothetical protein